MTLFYWMIEGYKDSFLKTERPSESCSVFSPNKTKDKIIKTLKDNKDNTIKYRNELYTAFPILWERNGCARHDGKCL